MNQKRKLIEVALPLEAINREAAREKSIRHGHPSTLHLWWARRPLVACRAVLFASLVDDPSAHPEDFPTGEDQERERKRLFAIIEELVKWENSNNEQVLAHARGEILKSVDGNLPDVLDPFCGGGSIPLEAQRLGLKSHASDLNPVAVLITKALIEIPPKFAAHPPINPDSGPKLQTGGWRGVKGLADDVRYYGKWMQEEAFGRIGDLYPKARLPEGGEATVIAWLWARTVKCPNPGCGARMPLVRSFELSRKSGRAAWIEPLVDQAAKTIRFEVRTGEGAAARPSKVGRGAKFQCLVCSQTPTDDHIKAEGRAGRMGEQLMAMVAEGRRNRIYLSPDEEHVHVARRAEPSWRPESPLANNPRALWTIPYGLTQFGDLFTDRQLVALNTLSDLVSEARDRALVDAIRAGLSDDGERLADGGLGAAAYADAVATYLGFGISRMTNTLCTIARWTASRDQTLTAFARQAIPMTWDFPEVNPFAGAAGDLGVTLGSIAEVLEALPAASEGEVSQLDATVSLNGGESPIVATDPPYYDNIGYAELADFFYVWLRRSLAGIHPMLFSTLLTPKEQELVATPYRFEGGKAEAERFFEKGLRATFEAAGTHHDRAYPMTIFYAFKQAESAVRGEGELIEALASTGWETMLEGLLASGFAITATWPMRSERGNRPIASGTNALASSIVLACRQRPAEAPLATRKEFVVGLRSELPVALQLLQHGNVAPVDLAQAAIGPGMAVFS